MAALDLMNSLRRMPNLYDAVVKLRDIYSLLKSKRLRTFSQHGEDIFISKYFSGKKNGLYVDVGASHPFRISNTYMLYNLGWNGVTVEPIPRLVGLHRSWRPRDTMLPVAVGSQPGSLEFFEMTPSVLSTLDASVANEYITDGKAVLYRKYFIDVVPINSILEKASLIAKIDFLSIDIEGLDADILSKIDFRRYRPDLICIEVNSDETREQLKSSFSAVDYEILTEIGCNIMAVPKIAH